MSGYYLPEFNFSVRYYSGQWCMFCRQTEDQPAQTPEQVAAVLGWVEINRRKYETPPDRLSG